VKALIEQARLTARVVAAVLRNRNLRRAELAFFGFNAVEYGTWTAALLYAYEATGPFSVGIVALVMLLPAAFVAPAAGTAADRHDRRRVLFLGYLVFALTLGAAAVAMLGGWPPAAVYLLTTAAAAALTLVRPTHSSILPSLARTPEELTAANGVSGMAEGAGWIVGPLVGAGVLAVASPGAVFALGALTCLGGAALVMAIRPARNGTVAAPGAAPAESYRRMLADGFRVLARDRNARLIVAIMSARMLLIGVMDVLMVLLALELFDTGESGASILNAALGTGTIVGGVVAFSLIGRRRLSIVVLAAALLWGLALGLVGAIATGTTAPLMLAVGSIGLAVIDVAGRTILQRTVADDVLARIFGVLEGLAMGGLAAGSVVTPFVVGLVGLQPAVIVFATILPIVVAISWPGLRRLDRTAVIPARELALLRRVPMFEVLLLPYGETVARRATWATVPAGRVVIRQGDVGDRFYVLASGRVRVTRDGVDVRDFTQPGDAFGEIALLRGVPRTATVTAIEETVLLTLDRAAFLEAVTGHPDAMAAANRLADERGGPIASSE
jgi:MFS family permease